MCCAKTGAQLTEQSAETVQLLPTTSQENCSPLHAEVPSAVPALVAAHQHAPGAAMRDLQRVPLEMPHLGGVRFSC